MGFNLAFKVLNRHAATCQMYLNTGCFRRNLS